MQKNILIVLIAFICLNCKQAKDNKIEKIDIEVSEIEYALQFDLSDNFIKLESDEESIIGKLDKIIINDDKIYILDKELTKSIFIFNDKGKYLYKIESVGKGPGEYIEPDDIVVDDDRLIIFDIDQEKLIYYKENQFIKEQRVDYEFYAIEKNNNNLIGVNNYCYEKSNCYKVFILNQELELQKKLSPFKQTQNRVVWDLNSAICKDEQGLYISEAFSNVIYQIDAELNYTPYLKIDFGKRGIDPDKKKESRDRFLEYISKTDKAFLIDNFKQNKYLRYFTFFSDQSLIHSFQLRESNKIVMVKSIQSKDRLVLTPLYLDENSFYFSIDAKNLIKYFPNYKKKFSDIKDIDNPVIYKMSVKKLCEIIDRY